MGTGSIIVVSSGAASTVTPAAGDLNFGQIKSNVAAYFGMDQDFSKVALAGQAVKEIIDQLNMRQVWVFNLVTSPEFNTSAGTTEYNLPTDFWKVYNARKSSDIDYQIDVVRQRQFDQIFVSQRNINGFPFVMVIKNTFRDGKVRLFPTPDAGYTFNIKYFKLIGKPTADTDFLDLPQPYQIVPQYGAKSRFAALVNQPSLMTYWQNLYDKAYGEMKANDEDMGDENTLRFLNVEEVAGRVSYINPAARPRAYDLY